MFNLVKKLAIFLLFTGVLFVSILFLLRQPRYTIETDGELYIVNKLSSTITVFDLKQGKEVAKLPMKIRPHELTAVSSLHKIVVSNYGSDDNIGSEVTIIDSDNHSIDKTIELQNSERPQGVITFPSMQTVGVATNLGNDLLVLDVESGSVKRKIPTHQAMSHLLVHHPSLPIVYITNAKSNSLSIIDYNNGEIVKTLSCGQGTEGIAITPDGKEIWLACKLDNTINVLDTQTQEIIHSFSTQEEPLRLSFSIDGKYCLVTNGMAGTVSVFDQKSKECIKIIYLSGKQSVLQRLLYHTPRPVGILVHPNGKYAFVSNSNADKVEVIDMKTFNVVSTIGTDRVPDGLALML